jgi:hypothetical protein
MPWSELTALIQPFASQAAIVTNSVTVWRITHHKIVNVLIVFEFFIPPRGHVHKVSVVFGFGPKGNRTSKLQCKGIRESFHRI